MNSEIFREKVEQELKTLTKEQVVQFAWRVTVRALPLLVVDGAFSFRDKSSV